MSLCSRGKTIESVPMSLPGGGGNGRINQSLETKNVRESSKGSTYSKRSGAAGTALKIPRDNEMCISNPTRWVTQKITLDKEGSAYVRLTYIMTVID